MKDVIFQGARNRQPSGMAEVVMHMVRDEVTKSEPDIEDIDSTLERIDDRLVNIDEILPQDEPQAAVETAPVEVAAVEGESQPRCRAVVPESTPAHKSHTSDTGAVAISRSSLRPAKQFRLRADYIDRARASTC